MENYETKPRERKKKKKKRSHCTDEACMMKRVKEKD